MEEGPSHNWAVAMDIAILGEARGIRDTLITRHDFTFHNQAPKLHWTAWCSDNEIIGSPNIMGVQDDVEKACVGRAAAMAAKAALSS